MLGHCLVDPGPYRRGELLAVRSKSIGTLALGCIPLLVLAGVIEAFFSPTPLPQWLKFAFAAISFGSLVMYIVLVGRTDKRDLGATPDWNVGSALRTRSS